jgi:uncharacterized RDD family membrane protein YckC
MVHACSNCGKPLNERSKFCPQCGAPKSSANAVVGAPVRVADAGEAAIDLGAQSMAPPQRRIVVVNAKASAVPVEPADFGQRLGAFLFDLLLFVIVLMVATFVLSSISKKSIVSSNSMLAAFYIAAFVLFALNFIVLAGRAGQTVGKRLVGIRIVRENGQPAGFASVLLRHGVGYALSALGAFLGFLWVIWDSKHQGWHDKIARTIVVLVR